VGASRRPPQSILFGFGAGDVNKDGRNDILTAQGWFEGPSDPRAGAWKWHADFKFTKDLSHLFALDINGDGRTDIVTSYAHDYGIFWLEQLTDGKWKTNMIDETWSQPHSPEMADLNGDGRPELIVGKRYMAHNGRDPGEREPLGVYWYEFLPMDGVSASSGPVTLSTTAPAPPPARRYSLPMSTATATSTSARAPKSGLLLFVNLSKR